MKKTILHIIHNLNRGGAETILVTTIRELTEYRHIVVTLFPGNQFDDELSADRFYCLKMKHGLYFLNYVKILKRIIKENQVDLVHSRLVYANFLARLATPKNIPLVTTIHAYSKGSIEYKRKYMSWLEKLTYKFHKTYMMADSKGALNEYFIFFKLKPYKSVSPYTFVDPEKFNASMAESLFEDKSIYRLVSVGRLTAQKNYQYLIEGFKYLKDFPVELHIFGNGPLYNLLDDLIKKYQVNKVKLRGLDVEVNKKLGAYDAYVMSSLYEGFSLAVLEAMATGLPLFLSDMPSFREQADDVAVFFDLSDPKDFATKLKEHLIDSDTMSQMGINAKNRVLNNFTLNHHLQIVRRFYELALEDYHR